MSAAVVCGFGQDNKDLEIKTTGYFIVDGGFISETEDVALMKWRNEPYGDFIGGLRLSAQPSERFNLVINPELKSHNIFPISPGIQQGESVQKLKYDVYLEEASGTWRYGNGYSLGFGYMIYKDNPDAHVFGDYLFRSMIYPALLFTKFDYPRTQIFGLHGSAPLLDGKLKNNLFLLSEVRNYPFFDLSLAYSGSYSVGSFFEVGLGVNARSLVPVRPSRTTPKGGEGRGLIDNTYKFVPFQPATVIKDSLGAPLKTVSIAAIPGTDSALVTITPTGGVAQEIRVKAKGNGIAGLSSGQLQNTVMEELTPNPGGIGDLYPELGGTNTHYTFAGTILTGRLAFDPLALVFENNPMGSQAFKLYTEVAVLGWKNYPGFYEKRDERMPIMAGIHLPTWNKLDFLTVEVERFKNHHLPTYDMRSFENVPQPGTHKGEMETEWDADRRLKDDIKWAVAAKKSFNGWGVVAQFGTDHTKLVNEEDSEVIDAMSRPGQWYVQLRFIGGVY